VNKPIPSVRECGYSQLKSAARESAPVAVKALPLWPAAPEEDAPPLPRAQAGTSTDPGRTRQSDENGLSDKESQWNAIAEASEKKGFERGFDLARQQSEDRERTQAKLLHAAIRGFEDLSRKQASESERVVVALSLAMAKRVLHHESSVDRLFLAGAVRYALDRIQDRGRVQLRVASEDLDLWGRLFANGDNPGKLETTGGGARTCELVADPLVSPGNCVIASDLGAIDLSVPAQLTEISKKFEDALDMGPAEEWSRRDGS